MKMIRTAAAIAILGAAALPAQEIDRTVKQRIHNNAAAEIKRGQLLRTAENFEQSFRNCQKYEEQKKNPNPYACETFKIRAAEKRAEASAVQAKPVVQPPQQQAPMYSQYDPARAANRQYPQGMRPDTPPQMIPSAGQVAQGVWHGISTGQTTFEEDPSKISGQPAVDFRQRMGGNAGVSNGQSGFGSQLGGGGGFRGTYSRGTGQPRIQPYRYPQQQPGTRLPQATQGRWVRGRYIRN